MNRRTTPIEVFSGMCDNQIASPIIPAVHVQNGIDNADFIIYANVVYKSTAVSNK